MANPTDVSHNPPPFSLSLKDFPTASTLSQRMKRVVAEDEELEVFAAEQYFSGALDMLKPCKTSPEKFSFSPPPQPTSSAFLEPTIASFMGWKPPILSLLSCFRKAPPASEESDNSFRKTSWSTQKWNEKRNNTINPKMKRSLGTATVDPDVEIFSESSSDLFELDTLSIRACASVVEKSPKHSSPGDTFGEETAEPVEWGLHQVGCWGRKALDVAAGVHRASVKHRSKKWDAMSRPGTKLSRTPRMSGPISALSLR